MESQKTDPFAKARDIRVMALDSELPSFDELKGYLQKCPQTWLPSLLRQIVVSCLAESVFQEGQLAIYVDRLVEQWNEPGRGFLRGDA